MEQDLKIVSVKMGTGAAVGWLGAMTINDVVAVATLVYLVLQILLLMPKFIEWYSAAKARRAVKRGD